MSRKVVVSSNDPETPQLSLTISCEIIVDVSVEPRRIVLGQIAKGKRSTHDFTVAVHDQEAIKVTGVTVSDERFRLKLVDGDPAGGGKYELSFGGDRNVGRINAFVNVSYEGSLVPEMRVPIQGEVVGDLAYNRSLFFSKKDDAFPEREITFTSRSGRPVKLTKVEDPDGKLLTEIRHEDGQAVLKARVADPDAPYERPSRHKLLVHTNNRDEPTVEISYTIADRTRRPLRPAAGAKRPLPIGPIPGIRPDLKAERIENKGDER